MSDQTLAKQYFQKDICHIAIQILISKINKEDTQWIFLGFIALTMHSHAHNEISVLGLVAFERPLSCKEL